MNHFLQHYTLKYTPLSPIHIGADESYEPGNYVIDEAGGALYGFDSHAALAGLSASEKQQLLTIVNGKPDDTMLTKVQAFFHNNREKLMAFATRPVPTATGIKALYEKRIGKTAQHESLGRRAINKLEIDRTFYNPVDGTPLLPGSSIKGAIRTALLDMENEKNDKTMSIRNERNQELQQRLFGGDKFHTDPMRLVSIGDAGWDGNQNKPACQIQFAVNRKRKPVFKDGNLMQSQAEASNLYQLLECVVPQHYQGFSGSITLQNTQSIAQDDRKLPKKALQWTIQDISRACNAFYMGLFWQELHAIKELNYLNGDWVKQMELLLEGGLLKRLNEGTAFLLRVGRHSGAEALTLNGIRSIKIMQGRGEKPKYEKAPLTWWLASDDISDKQNLLPFGWVLVEIDPKQPDSQLQQWLEDGNAELSNWYQQQLEKQNRLKDQAEAKQRQEREKKQAEEQEAEELRQQHAAEQQRLLNLSPVEQELEQFLKPIPPQEHDTRLLQELETGRWKDADAKQVANKVKALMEKAGKWLPDYTGDNKQKGKNRDRSLKVRKYLD